MKKWNVTLAYDAPYYATVIVEAETADEAERIALMDKAVDADFEPCWDASGDTHIGDDTVEE